METLKHKAIISNSLKDKATVNLGSWGADNIYGHVKDFNSNPISGAKVYVTNTSNGELGEDITNNNGKYDIDVNASSGNKIHIQVEWKDKNGTSHVIRGYVVVRGRSLIAFTDQNMEEENDELDVPIGATYLVTDEEKTVFGASIIEHVSATYESTNEVSVQAVKILPDVILPPAQDLKVGKQYTVTITHTLRVENDGQKVIQDNMVMSLHFPGVLSKPYSWHKNVYIKRNNTKSFRYTTSVKDVTPKQVGEFTLTGITEFYGSHQSKAVKFKVIA